MTVSRYESNVVCDKINNKVQLSWMIRSIRMRPVQKPLIVQEVIYNHREEVGDSNSEFSFLKLSQNASKELNTSPDLDSFHTLEMRLYKVQQKSALRLSEVQKKLHLLDCKRKGSTLDIGKDFVEENKENLRVAYQRVQYPGDVNDDMLECKFQMDEKFNYVKNKENIESESYDKIQVRRKEFYSLENSRKVERGSDCKSISRKPRPKPTSLNFPRSDLDNQSTFRHLIPNQKGVKIVKKRSISSDKPPKRGRVYQEILSLYTIPKLLAMELKLT